MAKVTRRGTELARKLQPMFEALPADRWSWFGVAATLSLIARHARTHHRLAEIACGRELTAEECRRDVRIEHRIIELAESLPGTVRAKFSGDPRGATVKLVLPGEWRRLHDCFGGEGVCV